MGYYSELDYELNNTANKGRTIQSSKLKEGEEWLNPRNKKIYVMKQGRLIIKENVKCQ